MGGGTSKTDPPPKLFEILGCEPNSSNDKLKRAYNNLSRQNLNNKEKLIDIDVAYWILSNEDMRKAFEKDGSIDKVALESYKNSFQFYTSTNNLEWIKQNVKHRDSNVNTVSADRGHSMLYLASRIGSVEMVKFLLDAGANPNLVTKWNESTPLHAACWFGSNSKDHYEILKYLIGYGANVLILDKLKHKPANDTNDPIAQKILLDSLNDPFTQAAIGDLDSLKKLENFDFFETKNTFGFSLVQIAARANQLKVVEFLMEKAKEKAKIDSADTERQKNDSKKETEIGLKIDKNGNTALHDACYFDFVEMTQLLLQNGANFRLQNNSNQSPEDLAGPKVNQMFKSATTESIFQMAQKGHLWWFIAFFQQQKNERNFTINSKDAKGQTALMHAVQNRHRKLVFWLITHGSDLTIKDLAEKTAKAYADPTDTDLLNYLDPNRSELFELDLIESEKQIKRVRVSTATILSSLFPGVKDKEDRVVMAGRALDVTYPVIQAIILSKYSNSRYLEFPIAIEKNPKFSKSELSTTYRISPADDITTTHFQFTHNVEIGGSDLYFVVGPLKFFFPKYCVLERCTLEIQTSQPRNGDRIIDFQITQISGSAFDHFEFNNLPTLFEAKSHERVYRQYQVDNAFVNWLGQWEEGKQHQILGMGRMRLVPLKYHEYGLNLKPDQIKFASDSNFDGTLEIDLNHKSLQDAEPCYHGTTLSAISMICDDSLLSPGIMNSHGKLIETRKDHKNRIIDTKRHKDHDNAVFLSPNLEYASEPSYAELVSVKGKNYSVVVKCEAASRNYEFSNGTVNGWETKEKIEMRVSDFSKVLVTGIILRPFNKPTDVKPTNVTHETSGDFDNVKAVDWLSKESIELLELIRAPVLKLWTKGCKFSLSEIPFNTTEWKNANPLEFDIFDQFTLMDYKITFPLWDKVNIRSLTIIGELDLNTIKEDLYDIVQLTLDADPNKKNLKQMIDRKSSKDMDETRNSDTMFLAAICGVFRRWKKHRERLESKSQRCWDWRKRFGNIRHPNEPTFNMVKTKEFVFDWFDNENVYGYEINGPNTFTILLDKTNEIPKAGLTSSGKVATDIQFKNHTIALIIEKRRKWEQYTENEIQKPKIEKPEIEKPKITFIGRNSYHLLNTSPHSSTESNSGSAGKIGFKLRLKKNHPIYAAGYGRINHVTRKRDSLEIFIVTCSHIRDFKENLTSKEYSDELNRLPLFARFGDTDCFVEFAVCVDYSKSLDYSVWRVLDIFQNQIELDDELMLHCSVALKDIECIFKCTNSSLNEVKEDMLKVWNQHTITGENNEQKFSLERLSELNNLTPNMSKNRSQYDTPIHNPWVQTYSASSQNLIEGIIVGAFSEDGVVNYWSIRSKEQIPFAKPGDSGSRIVLKETEVFENHSIGMILRGAQGSRPYYLAAALPLHAILESISLREKIRGFGNQNVNAINLSRRELIDNDLLLLSFNISDVCQNMDLSRNPELGSNPKDGFRSLLNRLSTAQNLRELNFMGTIRTNQLGLISRLLERQTLGTLTISINSKEEEAKEDQEEEEKKRQEEIEARKKQKQEQEPREKQKQEQNTVDRDYSSSGKVEE